MDRLFGNQVSGLTAVRLQRPWGWAAVLLVALFGSLAGADEAAPDAVKERPIDLGDPFYNYVLVDRPFRSYYAETVPDETLRLTDSEYASLNAGPTFYPFILDRWPTTPIDDPTYFAIDRPEYAVDKEVALQEQLLKANANPYLRAETITALALSRNPSAIPILTRQLVTEKDRDVIADLLRGLHTLKAGKVAGLPTFLTASYRHVRLTAVRLTMLQEEMTWARLQALVQEEKFPEVRVVLWDELARRAPEGNFATWLAQVQKSELLVMPAAVRGLCRFADVNDQQELLLKLCREAAEPVRREVATSLGAEVKPEVAAAVLTVLAGDPNGSIRAAATEAIGRLRLTALQPVLLKLAEDPRPAVRLAAAQQLREFPNRESFMMLVKLTGDLASPLTRNMARASLFAIAAVYPVEQELEDSIFSTNIEIRHNCYLLLAALKSKRYNDRLTQQLQVEQRPITLAAAIRALITGEGRAAEAAILAHAKHEAPEVRTAVAEAVGALNLAQGYAVLNDYALNDQVQDPRYAAVVGMGHTKSPAFAGTLLTVLKRTNYTSMTNPEFLTAVDRGAAAWAAAQMEQPDLPLMERMKTQITQQVIATPLGPAFDSDNVRVSAMWCLATQGKRHQDQKLLGWAQNMIKILGTPTGGAAGPGIIQAGPNDNCYAYQCAQFLAGQPVERWALGLNQYRFDYRVVGKKTPLPEE